MSWDNHTDNIQEAIFGDQIYVPDAPYIDAGKTPPGYGEGVCNAPATSSRVPQKVGDVDAVV